MKKNKASILILFFFSFLVLFGFSRVEAGCTNDNTTRCRTGGCQGYDNCCGGGTGSWSSAPGGEDECGGCPNGYTCCKFYCGSGNGGDTHKECDSDCGCVEVDGSGTDECDDDGDCYPCGECIPCGCGTSLATSEEERHLAESFLGSNDGSSQVLGERSFGTEEPLKLTSSNFLSYILDFINNILTKVKLVII